MCIHCTIQGTPLPLLLLLLLPDIQRLRQCAPTTAAPHDSRHSPWGALTSRLQALSIRREATFLFALPWRPRAGYIQSEPTIRAPRQILSLTGAGGRCNTSAAAMQISSEPMPSRKSIAACKCLALIGIPVATCHVVTTDDNGPAFEGRASSLLPPSAFKCRNRVAMASRHPFQHNNEQVEQCDAVLTASASLRCIALASSLVQSLGPLGGFLGT